MKIDECPDIPNGLKKSFASMLTGVDAGALTQEEYEALDLENVQCIDRDSHEFREALRQISENEEFNNLINEIKSQDAQTTKEKTKIHK